MREVKHICVMLDPLGSNSMKSANPNSGFHRISVWPCLDTTNPSPTKAQGGGVIVALRASKKL